MQCQEISHEIRREISAENRKERERERGDIKEELYSSLFTERKVIGRLRVDSMLTPFLIKCFQEPGNVLIDTRELFENTVTALGGMSRRIFVMGASTRENHAVTCWKLRTI